LTRGKKGSIKILMTDEVGDVEGPRVPPEIFPIGADAVTEVLKLLPQPLTYAAMAEYVRTEVPMLEKENPYAIGYLMSFASNLPENEELEFRLGVTLAYKISKQRAGEQGLSMLSYEFVRGYQQARQQRLSTASAEKKEEEIQKGLFPKLEPDAYQALEQGMVQRGYQFSSSAISSGIVSAYPLFREGFSGPSHREQRKQGLN
jgi:hypothetical protein